MALDKPLIPFTTPVADPKNVIVVNNLRITVLFDRLFRVEVGGFCDEATQEVFHRDTPPVNFTYKVDDDVVVTTDRVQITVSKNGKIKAAYLDGNKLSVRDKGNLGGTCRTVDNRIGSVNIGKGIISRTGLTYLEDSSLALKETGMVGARDNQGIDYYVFAYGKDYRGAMKAFYSLTGSVPMLPRYVFGNWWSRYRAYTQEEYLAVMERFEKENLPFTVATVDMDWHWVKEASERFGAKKSGLIFSAGWTGYSWNTDLFPDYREFLRTLQAKNYHVTLNLHPADGVRFFEDQYKDFAEYMGIDPSSKEPIKFDLGSEKFLTGYFKYLHHPYEEEGVDFWWIDWQQGTKSTVEGLDPLWALNHYHYLDNNRSRRGLVLSRYAKEGSHRYPLGFSGDSVTYWKSLDFQPYMTATASNVGYGYWSHDIGGHTFGVYDDELYLRWCQYGVFSPINRLHSTSHDLMGKEPWKHSEPVRRITSDYLRLRHRLIPYIYSATRRASYDGIPLCEPMYYTYPDEENAYLIKNEYFFGSELIVCPITSKLSNHLNMSKTRIWVPEGRYTDVFTGKVYNGNKVIDAFRDLEYIPVLAKEGAMIPLSNDEGNLSDNPHKMEILIYRGNNSYTLYEDDGISKDYIDGEYAETTFTVTEKDGQITFVISAPAYGKKDGAFSLPKDRLYKLTFKDLVNGKVTVNGATYAVTDEILVPADTIVTVTDYEVLTNGNPLDNARLVLSRYQGSNLKRILQYWGMKKDADLDVLVKKVKRRFPKDVYLAVVEATL